MKWTVAFKIASGFALTLLIFVIVGAVSYQTTNALIEASTARQRAYEALRGVNQAFSQLKDVQMGARSYALTGKEESLQPYTAALGEIGGELREARNWTQDNLRHQARLDKIEQLVKERLAASRTVIEARRSQGMEAAALEVTNGTGDAVMDDVRQIVAEMQQEENAILEKQVAATVAHAATALRTIVFGTLAAIVLSGLAGFLITRDIAQPLRRLTEVAEHITAGNLNVDLPTQQRSDEVGTLTQALARMTQSMRAMALAAAQIASGDLRTTVKPQSAEDALGNAFARMTTDLNVQIRELVEGANVLGAAASEIVAATSQLAASANESAAAVSETTTTVEEVRQTARLATEKAKLVADNAEGAMQISQSGRQSADSVVAGMDRVRRQMEVIAASMVRLSEQSQAIGQIIAMVEDIATQSNLLAVNAAIEAARAGEHGKGFGVVAHEVKSLADQSRAATNQVRTLLSDIQKATNAAVMATEEGGKVVQAGAQQTSAAAASLQMLANNANESAQAAVQIAASNQQQLVGVDQVAGAMDSIRQASTQNVTSARQLEVAARNVNELGQRLKLIVDRYRV